MFKIGDHVVEVRRDRPAKVVKLMALSSGRIGFACEWTEGGRTRQSFFLEKELKLVAAGAVDGPARPTSSGH